MEALGWTLMFGLPALLGLLYVFVKFVRGYSTREMHVRTDQVSLSLMVLCAGWLGWYVVFSVGNLRYLFPVVFIAGIFTSEMLCTFTGDLTLPPWDSTAGLCLAACDST